MAVAGSGGSPGCRGAVLQCCPTAEGVFLRSLGLVSPSTPKWPGGVGRETRAELPNPGLKAVYDDAPLGWLPASSGKGPRLMAGPRGKPFLQMLGAPNGFLRATLWFSCRAPMGLLFEYFKWCGLRSQFDGPTWAVGFH